MSRTLCFCFILFYVRFKDLCPIACRHFVDLVTGIKGIHPVSGVNLTYEGCQIHRIVKNGWLQTGDIVDGTGTHSITTESNEQLLADESFTADFGFYLGGVVGLSNTGPHSNGSQFFITLGACEWMNTKFVGIGRVLFGYKVLEEINKAATENQRPNLPIVIKLCGRQLQ